MVQLTQTPKSQMPARVLIVDDHPIVREGLTALLEIQSDLTVCGEAEDISSALKRFDETTPDVVVTDLSLAHESGLELIHRIRSRNQNVPILVVSMYEENLYGERVIQAGAMGYLNKHSASRNIVSAIRRILEGKHYLSEELSERLLLQNMHGKRAVPRIGVDKLSDRELEVFRWIGSGKTTIEIAAGLHLSVKTIETHRQKIKTKLNLRNTAELSREAAQWTMQN